MFVMKYFYKFLTILLGIVVSALAFHAGGSIPRLGKIFKLTFSPFSPSPPDAITKPSSLYYQPLKSLIISPLKELLRGKECQL